MQPWGEIWRISSDLLFEQWQNNYYPECGKENAC